MTGPPEPGQNPYKYPIGKCRDRIQSRVYTNLKRIPSIDEVYFSDSDTGVGKQIIGTFHMDVFADGVVTSDSAYVKINWWPLQDGDQPWFQIHYIESDGFNCGWH